MVNQLPLCPEPHVLLSQCCEAEALENIPEICSYCHDFTGFIEYCPRVQGTACDGYIEEPPHEQV